MVHAERSPKVDGIEATFWHIDDVEWTEVKRQRNADGSTSSVWEKWPILRPDFLSAYIRYDAGMVSRRHGHLSNHIVFLLEGGAWIGGEWYGPNTHIELPLGAAFGPIVGGPDGATFWELMFGDWRGWGDQPELYERELAARGVTPLPDPPLDFGDWHHDIRDYWASSPTQELASPKIDGLEAVIRVMDDLTWTEVKQQRNADGTESAIREKWPIVRPDFMPRTLHLVDRRGRRARLKRANHIDDGARGAIADAQLDRYLAADASPRDATRSCRSAACNPTTPARSSASPATSA